MIVRNVQRAIAKRLSPVAKEDAALEASFLLRANGFHSPYQTVSETDRIALERQIERRLNGEPLQYILGEWEFYGLPMYVDPSVLIPRPDTECLVEAALKRIDETHKDVLDLCCGSGCIGIALAVFGGARVTAVDISADALTVAERNAHRNAVSIRTIRSDFLDDVDGTYDLIVCNPPYLNAEEMASRDRSLIFEPAIALDGGQDGLSFYRRLAKDYRRYLRPCGTLFAEIGTTQRAAVSALFDGAECIEDYGGRPRVIVIRNDD